MGLREARANQASFLVAWVAMTIGVAGAYALSVISSGFSNRLTETTRQWIAADIDVFLRQSPTPEQLQAVSKLDSPLRWTLLTETGATVSSSQVPDPIPVYVRVLDLNSYPFYGDLNIKLAGTASRELDPFSVFVSKAALKALQVRTGEQIRIHSTEYRIAGVIESEPALAASVSSVFPHMILSPAGFGRTGILRFGGIAFYQLLFKMPQHADAFALCHRLEVLFPEGEVLHYTTVARILGGITDEIKPTLNVLSIVFLTFAVLGVFVASYLHLLRRFEAIAILRSLGATTQQVRRIYSIQILLVAIAATGTGIIIGQAVAEACAFAARHYLGIQIHSQPKFPLVMANIASALLAAGAAAWLPLSRIRVIPAALLLRRDTAERQELAWSVLQKSRWGAALLIAAVAIIISIVIGLDEPWRIRLYFAATVVAGVGAVFILMRAVIAGFCFVFRSAAAGLPFLIQYGVRNLQRYRRQVHAIALVLACGAALAEITSILQQQMLGQLLQASPVPITSLVFLNASTLERQQLTTLFQDAAGVRPRWFPLAWLHLVKAGGMNIEQLRAFNPHFWVQKTWVATCADSAPRSSQLVAGHWWNPGSSAPKVALEQTTSDRLGLRVGSTVEFSSDGPPTASQVAAIFRLPPLQQLWDSVVFNCSTFQRDPVYYGSVGLPPVDVPRALLLIQQRVPGVLAIDATAVLKFGEHIAAQSAQAIRFCAIFVFAAGSCLLLGITRALRFFRMHEVAVLRAVGARPRTLLAAVLIEYATLGGLSGIVGVCFGSGASTAALFLITGTLRVTFNPLGALISVFTTAAIAGAMGLWGLRELFYVPPLEVLRGQ